MKHTPKLGQWEDTVLGILFPFVCSDEVKLPSRSRSPGETTDSKPGEKGVNPVISAKK